MAAVRTREVTTKASWLTATAAKVHSATRGGRPQTRPRAGPRPAGSGTRCGAAAPRARSACAATPSVAVPATSQIIVGVHAVTPASVGSPRTRKAPRPAMLTMLATAGAHMYAANWPRALRTWPSSV